MFSRRKHRLARDSRSRSRECAENSTRMKPASAFSSEDLIPINIARLQLRDGGMTAIRTTGRGANSVATFRKVQAIAYGSPDAIELNPVQMRLVHAALIDQILH